MLTASEAYNEVGRLHTQLNHSIEQKLQLQQQLRAINNLGETDHRQRLNNNRELLALTEVKGLLARVMENNSKECQQVATEIHQHDDLNEYQFLRAVWTGYRVNEDTPLDDRLDRLNKIVAMVRGNLTVKHSDLRFGGRNKELDKNSEVPELLSEPSYLRLKEKMEAALMEKEEAIVRMHAQLLSHSRLTEEHSQLQGEMKRAKEKIRSL